MSSKASDFDAILREIGPFGIWQKKIFGWMCLASMAAGMGVVVYVFTGFEPKYRCAVPLCENITTATYGFSNKTYPYHVQVGLPKEALENSKSCMYYGISKKEKTEALEKSPSTCNEYLEAVLNNDSTIELMTCSHDKLIFDDTYVKSSTPSLFGLTCESSYLRNIYGSAYMIGLLCGSIILGILSDKCGRKTALITGVVILSCSGFICAFVPQGPVYAFFRFLSGIGGMGCFMVSFVICIECVGVKYTMLTGVLIEVPFAIGGLLLGLEAFLIRDFFTLQLLSYTPYILLVIYWFVLPESPRWLIAMKRFDEAEKIIREAAKTNERDCPSELLESIRKHDLDNFPKLQVQTEESDIRMATTENENLTILHLFYPKEILLRTLNMFYQWFSVTLCYYGLSYSSTSLLGDPYTNFCLSVFIEIPGYFFCVFVMNCWGRRPILSFTQIVSGSACIVAGLIAKDENLAALQLCMSLIGKFGASASFAIIYVYAAELYPTALRNTAIGSCSMIARLGSICALLIGLLGGSAPMLILGIAAVLGGFLALLFPETVRSKLPGTIKEAIDIGKNSTRGICSCICPSSFKEIFREESG